MAKASKLMALHKKAYNAYHDKNISIALECFLELASLQNDWEHGDAHYMAAYCYEQLGNFEGAEKHYLEALKIEPLYEIWLGGYASFLFLHGSPEKAFKAHVLILSLEQSEGNTEGAKTTKIALKSLCEKMGMDQEACNKKIRDELAALKQKA